MRSRIIPILLLKKGYLYKTRKFTDETYLGDPINSIRIFNEKEVDELIFLDIEAAKTGADPDIPLLKNIAGECFMPLSYGGGVRSVELARQILAIGFEKLVVNTIAWTNPAFVTELADRFGSSTVVGSIDVRRNWLGKEQVLIRGGTEKIKPGPEEWARRLEQLGVGEILINSVDRDGEMSGYDLELVKRIALAVNVPVVAAGGAGSIDDMRRAIREAGAAAAAAGAMFVFQGKHRAVLISYPAAKDRAGL
jgi:cyclase